MATPTHTEKANPPRRTLAAGIATGAAIGAGIGIVAAFILVGVLGAVEFAEPLAIRAYLFLGFEAGFAGAVLGGAFAGLMRLRNTK
ncbi:MAG: hypothetical protein ACLFQ5_05925 [Oceanicaulis sp.]